MVDEPRRNRIDNRLLSLARVTVAALLAAFAVLLPPAPETSAVYETGTYLIRSPVDEPRFVTTSGRYHNGPNCPVELFDSPRFDSSDCTNAAIPVGGHPPDWAIDVHANAGDFVYVDVYPLAEGGAPAGGLYRVVAGDIYQWDSTPNGKYQYFGIHTWNPEIANWENYGWIRLGHIQSFTAPGSIVISPTTEPAWAAVGRVAPAGGYLEHVHMDFYNERGWSRAFNWDGPSNSADATWGPPCNPAGGNADDCNTTIAPYMGVGFIGGRFPAWSQVDNPYYSGF